MNTENFDLWIETLRSTTRPQAHGTLFEKFDSTGAPLSSLLEADMVGPFKVGACCLGIGTSLVPGVDRNDLVPGCRGMAPSGFIEWLGFPVAEGDALKAATESFDLVPDWPYDLFGRNGQSLSHATAADLNDSWRFTFAQIADVFAYFGVREAV